MTDGIIIWSPGVTLEAVEQQVIIKAYEYFKYNKSATARALGIVPNTLDSKLEKYEQQKRDIQSASDAERKRREEFLARARGVGTTPNNVNGGIPVAPGVRVEPVKVASPQQPVPMPERQEVKAVLPQQPATRGRGRPRKQI